MEVEYVNEKIGKKIRDLRNQNGLTQQELADRTELTKGYISQLERGQVTPSVITLLDLIECLGTTASEFFEEAHEEQIVYSEDGFFEKIDEGQNSIQWIVPTAQNNQMEPLLVVIQPHQTLPEDKPHDGEEFGYLIEGEIVLHLDENTYDVKEGQSFYYPANRMHYIENISDEPAKFVWVSTPPSF
ncbi:MAG: XRE family transcriptional regulator [Eubacteriales bacterium]|nr:XRE family transcriptional regulator [Eubacteriales bacterium]